MINRFKPTWMMNKIYDISPQFLQKNGIRAIFTDLDNTLVPWNEPYGNKEARKWMQELKAAHVLLIVVSNNRHSRVKRAAKNLNLPFVSRALKPFSFGINRGIKEFGLNRSQIVMVGDQLLTDIWGANNSNVKSIWVQPLVKSDALNTQFNRLIENKIKKRLFNKYPNLHW